MNDFKKATKLRKTETLMLFGLACQRGARCVLNYHLGDGSASYD